MKTTRTLVLLTLAAATTAACEGPVKGGGAAMMVEIAADDLVEDFEDGDDALLDRGSRKGFWYGYNDETMDAQQSPDPNAPKFEEDCGEERGKCLHFTGSGFKMWGAGMAVDLNNNGMNRGTYDVSSFKGLAFMAKGNKPIRVGFANPKTLPPPDGDGTCEVDGPEGKMCHDVHGMTVSTSKDWRQFQIPFARIKQEGFGPAVAFDPTKVFSVQFDMNVVNAAFDVSIDDVGFYK